MDEKQIRQLERAVTGYFDYIEELIKRENDFTMEEFSKSVNEFLAFRRYAAYMRLSVAEKVCCYPFSTKGTDSAFEMVKAYFNSVGLSADFDSVYEETKLLTDYYEKQKTEEFLQEQTEQITEKMDVMGVDAERFAECPADVLSEAFGLGDMEYFAGIRMFNQVLDKLGVDMTHQERYEMFDKIYEEGMRERGLILTEIIVEGDDLSAMVDAVAPKLI